MLLFKYIVCIFLILILFYLIHHRIIDKQKIQEHYLTFFLPFYDDSKHELSNSFQYFRKVINLMTSIDTNQID